MLICGDGPPFRQSIRRFLNTPHPEATAVRFQVSEQFFSLPKGRENAVELRLMSGPCHRQNDLVSIRAAEQIAQQQILFIVEALAPLFRVVPGQEDVVHPPNRSGPQCRHDLDKEDSHVRVRETAVAIVDEQKVVRPDPLLEFAGYLFHPAAHHLVAQRIDDSVRMRIDRDDPRLQT